MSSEANATAIEPCACGATLVESADAHTITVDGRTFPYRRSTDFVVCPSCGAFHRVSQLRAPEAGERP